MAQLARVFLVGGASSQFVGLSAQGIPAIASTPGDISGFSLEFVCKGSADGEIEG
jgi:hypothetical protein